MSIRLSRLSCGVLAAAAVVLMASSAWAVFFPLGPSKNEWGLKYNVELKPADKDKVTVRFTLADEGRLKPINSASVIALTAPDSGGGRSYNVKAKIEFKTTKDGKRVGQVEIPQKFVDSAMIRILTLSVDGRQQTAGAAYYDVPLKKFLDTAPVAGSAEEPAVATPGTKVVK